MTESNREPGGWELLRAIQAVQETLKTVATTAVLQLYQEGNDRRHQENEKRQAAWEAKSEAAHVGLDAKIDALEDKLAERERQDRAAKSGRILTVAAAVFAGVISIAGIVVGAVMR